MSKKQPRKPPKVETVGVSMKLPRPLFERLEAYRNSLPFEPDRSKVMERALVEFLDRAESES